MTKKAKKSAASGGRAKPPVVVKTPKRLEPDEVECAMPRQVDQPSWEDMNGDKHHDVDEAIAVNMKTVVEMIVERHLELTGESSPSGPYPEDLTEFVIENRDLLMIALTPPKREGQSCMQAFDSFMTREFGTGWRLSGKPDDIALRDDWSERGVVRRARARMAREARFKADPTAYKRGRDGRITSIKMVTGLCGRCQQEFTFKMTTKPRKTCPACYVIVERERKQAANLARNARRQLTQPTEPRYRYAGFDPSEKPLSTDEGDYAHD